MSDFDLYLKQSKHIHIVGAGGVSMSALCDYLHKYGVYVTGSDSTRSDVTDRLEAEGIHVFIGHNPSNLVGVDAIVKTAAVHDDNPEIKAAHELGIPVFERAQAWGYIMKGFLNALCVAGTHGKTTTTAMCTHIALAAMLDPTVMIGGHLPVINSNYRIGKNDLIIAESCEYCNSFLSFYPTVSVILNIEEDHLDFFRDIDDIKNSFLKFASLARDVAILNYDDKNTMSLRPHLNNVITYGLDENADIHPQNVSYKNGYASFDIIAFGEFYSHIELSVPGEYNLSNALAACAWAYYADIPGDVCTKGLNTFYGAGRRFEFKGELCGARVYDDYAHHPSELQALFSAVSKMEHNRIICIFQPHTYSRTAALFDDFVAVLKIPDVTVLCEIYAAREKNTGLSSASLAEHIPNSKYFSTFEEVCDYVRSIVSMGDIVLTVGAGNVSKIGNILVEKP